MGPNITKFIILSILYLIIKPQISIHGQQEQVPCLFFMGDSLFDNGNNNFLLTTAKANYLPYGIDYPNGPTGRFSNGRNIPDFIAEFLGFEKPIPPFATANDHEILKGVNYGSGGAGILDESGRRAQGDVISMNRQLLNHGISVSKIARLLRNATQAKEYLNKCLYGINMGTNDYLNNYFLPQLYLTSTLYTPDEFAAVLIQQYSRQLRTLYEYGARKIGICGLAQLGCVPQELSKNSINGFYCNEAINNAVQLFNNKLKPLVDNLNSNLPDAQFIYLNTTSIQGLDPSPKGYKVGNAPCCVISEPFGLCARGQDPCSNRNEYAFWDNFHPSEHMYRATAARAYSAALPSDAYPVDIRHLVQKH